MPLADYAHHNEDARRVWWEEEGKHAESDSESWREDEYSAEDAFAENLAELEDDQLQGMLEDDDYLRRWPKAERLIRLELRERG